MTPLAFQRKFESDIEVNHKETIVFNFNLTFSIDLSFRQRDEILQNFIFS